ncbi:MAG: DUF2085 domain-containing protein [Acidobacteriota bacterium]
MPRLIALGLTLGAVLWCATLFLAPFAVRGSHPYLAVAAASVYGGASLICHQRPERSFHLGGVQQPVCARCAGLYVSGCFGALAAWVGGRRPRVPRRTRTVLALAAIPTAITFGVELLGLAYPSNSLRAISALPLGAAAAWVFVRALRAEGAAASRARAA